MNTQIIMIPTMLVACAITMATTLANAEVATPKKYRAVVIQGAGYLPDGKKPEGADAITSATSKINNTYDLTKALVAKLAAQDVDVEVKSFSDCKDLTCLDASADGKIQAADIVIFAGPEYNGKHPKQLSALYAKIKEVSARNPGLVCSSLTSGGNPQFKGSKAAAHADNAFRDSGAQSVLGIGFNSPRGDNPGASAAEIDKSTADFAARLVEALKRTKEEAAK